jgi:hypothetical protein
MPPDSRSGGQALAIHRGFELLGREEVFGGHAGRADDAGAVVEEARDDLEVARRERGRSLIDNLATATVPLR